MSQYHLIEQIPSDKESIRRTVHPFRVNVHTANKFIFLTTRFSSENGNENIINNAKPTIQWLTIDETSITSVKGTTNERVILIINHTLPHDALGYKQEHDCIEDVARRVLEDEAGCKAEGIYTGQGLRHIYTENAQRDEEQDDESNE
jgi:hypothetical protein